MSISSKKNESANKVKRVEEIEVDDDIHIEYSRDNRFPFRNRNSAESVFMDDSGEVHDLDFIYGKIIERFPALSAERFYSSLDNVRKMKSNERVRGLKIASDRLLIGIRELFDDEEFVHSMHDRWGVGLKMLIETMYAVYGYYFYTGKRTANIIKKTIDGYRKKPVY